jgi:probable phosphoglycerate mutase
MTRIVLVRHGETIWHAENRYAGVSDISLTLDGLKQAEMLGRWAANAGLSGIWVSPLTRAITTVEPTAQATKLEPKIDARLREIDFGQAEGKTLAELETEFPGEVRAFKSDPVAHPFPGGENPWDTALRAVDCFRDIAQVHPGQRVLVVAHNTLLRLALCQILEIPLRTYRTVFPSIRSCALTEIQIAGGETSLLQYNAPLASSFGK